MQLELSKKEFRRLLDLVYIGNWILNSTRGDDRIADYDQVESKLFALCRENGMPSLVERWNGEDVPSRAFSDGGIHEAIADYEDTVFYEILAEELARRDMDYQPVSNENYDALVSRMDDYIAEFEAHGTDNISIPTMDDKSQTQSVWLSFCPECRKALFKAASREEFRGRDRPCRCRMERRPASRTKRSAARYRPRSQAACAPCCASLQASAPRAKSLFPRRKRQSPSRDCGRTTPASKAARSSARPPAKAPLRPRAHRFLHRAQKEARAAAYPHSRPADTP